MLHLARGQLNRAYRQHGLPSPDPLCCGTGADVAELDDPIGRGIDPARATYGDAYAAWEAEMPTELVGPILDILNKAHVALSVQRGADAAGSAALEAVHVLQTIMGTQD